MVRTIEMFAEQWSFDRVGLEFWSTPCNLTTIQCSKWIFPEFLCLYSIVNRVLRNAMNRFPENLPTNSGAKACKFVVGLIDELEAVLPIALVP